MTFKTLFSKVIDVVELVEEKKDDFVKSSDKKEYAVSILNTLIDIPALPEFIEEKAIGLMVDLTVYLFNKYGWFKK